MLYDVADQPSQIQLLADQYPDVPFIIPHLGSFADDWKAQAALIDSLERYRNIFTDTSGIRRFDLLEDAVRRAGTGANKSRTDLMWSGDIIKVGLRSVRMNTLDHNIVTIPNNKFLTDITSSGNYGNLEMQVAMDFHVGIDQDVELAAEIEPRLRTPATGMPACFNAWITASVCAGEPWMCDQSSSVVTPASIAPSAETRLPA